jgi:hypothetical protein
MVGRVLPTIVPSQSPQIDNNPSPPIDSTSPMLIDLPTNPHSVTNTTVVQTTGSATDSQPVSKRDSPQASFVTIGAEKLAEVNIDPNNRSSLHVRFDLYKQHPVNLSSMPKGKWTLDHLINILNHPTMGLGINCPKIPKSLVEVDDEDSDEKVSNQYEAVISFIDSCKFEDEHLDCLSSAQWSVDKSKDLFARMTELNKQIGSALTQPQILSNWAEILRDDSAVVQVHSANDHTSTAMILKFDNHRVCMLVALHLLAWSSIADLYPDHLASVHNALAISGDNNQPERHRGSRARDRRHASKATSSSSVTVKRAKLSNVDKLPLMASLSFLTTVPSTALSLYDSQIQFGKARWISVMIKGIPWSRLHYSADAFHADTYFTNWRHNEVKHGHRLFVYETRPEPRVAMWLPTHAAPDLSHMSNQLRTFWPEAYLEATVVPKRDRGKSSVERRFQPIRFTQQNTPLLSNSNLSTPATSARISSVREEQRCATTWASVLKASTGNPTVNATINNVQPANVSTDVTALLRQIAELKQQVAALEAKCALQAPPPAAVQSTSTTSSEPQPANFQRTSSTKRARATVQTKAELQNTSAKRVQPQAAAPPAKSQKVNNVSPESTHLSASNHSVEISDLRQSYNRLSSSVSEIHTTLASIATAVSRLTANIQSGSLARSTASDPTTQTHEQ